MAYTPKFESTPEGKRLQEKYNQLKKELAAQGFSMAGNTVVDYKTDARSSKSYTIGVGGGLKDGMGNTVPMAR